MSHPVPVNPFFDHIYSELVTVQNGYEDVEEAPELHVPVESTSKTCPICKKELPLSANLSFHLMLHPWTEKPYACDHCLFVTMEKEELTEHCKEQHPSNRKYICAICNREYTNARSLNKHKPIHAVVLPFSCAYCDRGFPEYVQWRRHEVAHKTARFECEYCEVRFTTFKYFTEHHSKGTCRTEILECCKQVFPNRIDYVNHCLEHHRFHKKQEYECEFCKKMYAFQCQLNIHKRNCSMRTNKPKVKSSKISSGQTINLDAFSVSIPDTTLKPVLVSKDGCVKRVFRCDICQKEFTTKSWLIHHRQRHFNPNFSSYVCSYCSMKFLSYSALYYHKKRIHLKSLPFKCTYCQKCFPINQGLRDHLPTHTGEQPYGCNYCPKKFRYRNSRTEHERIHTGEQPYKCQYCEESFKRRTAKLAHERRHTGERPFKCRICNLCFAQDSTMRSHEKRHQPPFTCTVCEQVFTSRETLIEHKKGHLNAVVAEEQEEVSEQVSYKEIGWNETGMATDTDGKVYIRIQYQAA